MSRKTGIVLRKEYTGLLDKTKALEARIKDRANELMTKHPDVLIGEITTAGEFLNGWNLKDIDADKCLGFIEKIEQHLADQHPHQQKKMF